VKFELFDSDSLNFVELNITGDNDNYIRCDEESKYLSTEIFNIFQDCFEKSNNLYEYFEPTKFNTRSIVPLLNNFKEKLIELNNITTFEEFVHYIETQNLGTTFLLSLNEYDKSWKDHWHKYLKKIIKINEDIISLIDVCMDEDLILWVIGY
jgi:hypothetical protein